MHIIWANGPDISDHLDQTDHLDHALHQDHLDHLVHLDHPNYPRTLFIPTNLTTDITLNTWTTRTT